MIIEGANIKTGLCTIEQIHYLTKLVSGSKVYNRTPMSVDKAYKMLTLICVAELSSSLSIIDNFETLYKRVFIYAKNN